MMSFLPPSPNYLKIQQVQNLIKNHINSDQLLIGYKDHNIIIQQTNAQVALGCGFKRLEDINGKSHHELQCRSVALADSFVAQDKKTLSGKKLITFDMTCYLNGIRFSIVTRIPVINEHFNIIGSVFFADNRKGFEFIKSKNIKRLINMPNNKNGITLTLHEESVLLEQSSQDDKLSQKEKEILWLLARGLSPKRIAHFFNRSPRTIESHIDNIKIKYDCCYKSELIEKAIDNHILNYLPFKFILRNPLD